MRAPRPGSPNPIRNEGIWLDQGCPKNGRKPGMKPKPGPPGDPPIEKSRLSPP